MEKLTKQQFRERFANIKVYVDGKSKEITDKLSSCGFTLNAVEKGNPFLLVLDSGNVDSFCNMDDFETNDFRNVTAEEILGIEIIEDEPQFKLKDEVVARLCNSFAWFHGYFSNMNPDKKSIFKYILSGGFSVKYCLPYNEKTAKLIGTTNDYKEDEQ